MKEPDKTKTLLQQALGLDAEAQTVMLDNIADATIKSQVETMLADPERLQQFLQQPAVSESDQPPQVGIQPGSLIKRIRVIKLLGQGGMGAVYLGFDEKLERQVAIKSIRPEHLENPATQQRFVREAQILSQINHPTICQLYDYIETAAGDFLVLEYINGKPLYQTPLTFEQKLTALAELATALAVAHEHGIVHRDLKPDNIMMTDEGDLKVLDFGIAQSLSQSTALPTHSGADRVADNKLTQQGSLVGTIRYMSPEQAQGQTIDTASDLYALGIIAQEIFSHQAAYQVLETTQLLNDVRCGNKLPVAGLPAPLIELIEQLTQLNPSHRPTALAAVERINALINAPKLKKQRTIKYSASIIGVLLLLMLLWQWRQFDNQANRSQQIKQYETKINALVRQAEQIYVLPIHPVYEEINGVLIQGESLYGVIQNDALLTDVDKHRLLGIILLRGENYADSIPLLERGLAENHWLAEAWSKLYIRKATEYSNKMGFEKSMYNSDLKEKYLAPALKYIEQTYKDSGQVDPMFRAFELSQTASLSTGLEAVNGILDDAHWNQDAVNLKAMILSASMTQAREKGEWELAKELADMTAATYKISTQMARSYPPGYASLCFVSLGLMADAIQRSGEQVETYTAQSIAACENVLKLQPENKYPMQLLTKIYLLQAQWQINYGMDANDSIAQAKHWNQQASSLENWISNSWNQASILAVEGRQRMLQGKAAEPTLDQSLEVLNKLYKVDTVYQPYVVSDLLFVLALQAQNKLRLAQHPEMIFQQAQTVFDATMLTPDLTVNEQRGLVANMAQVYMVELWNQFEQGQNIQLLANKLISFLNTTDSQIDHEPQQLLILANAHLLVADYLRQHHQSLGQNLLSAAGYIETAQAINSTDYNIQLSHAKLLTLQQYFSNQDYHHANQLYALAIAQNPHNPYSQLAWAEGLLIQAQSSRNTSERRSAIHAAAEQLHQALSVDPHNQIFINKQEKLRQLAVSLGIVIGL